MRLYFLYKTITLLMLGWFSYETFFGSELRYLIASGILFIMNFMIVLKQELDDVLKKPRKNKSIENLNIC